MLVELTEIISQYMQIKPSCCMPWTYTMMHVNYFLIKLENFSKELCISQRKGFVPQTLGRVPPNHLLLLLGCPLVWLIFPRAGNPHKREQLPACLIPTYLRPKVWTRVFNTLFPPTENTFPRDFVQKYAFNLYQNAEMGSLKLSPLSIWWVTLILAIPLCWTFVLLLIVHG